MLSRLTIPFFGLIILSGCGGSHNPEMPNLQTKEPLIDGDSIESYKGKVRLDPNTPEGLVLVLASRGYSVSSCTGVMIADDLVLTHSSCVDTKGSYSACSKDVGLAIKTFSGSEWRTCKKLIGRTDTGPALIELSSPVKNVKIHNISRKGILPSEELIAHAMDTTPSTENIRGTYKTSVCTPRLIDIGADIPKEKVDIIPMFDEDGESNSCTILLGNTGAPLKNKKGEIVALAVEAENKELELPYSPYLPASKISNIAFAENLSCANFNHDFFDRTRSLQCDEFLEAGAESRRQAVKISGQGLVEYMEQEAQLLKNTLPQSFKYEVKMDNSSSERPISFTPTCMLPLREWSSEELSNLDRRGFFGRRRYYSTVLPTFGLSMGYVVDEEMNLSIAPKITKTGSVDIIGHNINVILGQGTGNIIVRSTFDTELSMKLCP